MQNKKLLVHQGFKNLVRPMDRKEYSQLESSIAKNGCPTPITTWQSIIIDGFNEYEICTRLSIPYTVEEMEFDCKEEAIAWICAKQLKRVDLPFETKKFLIGMQYEAEKVLSTKRSSKDSIDEPQGRGRPANSNQVEHKTAKRIGDENFVSHTTVQKYAAFTRALEEIGKKEPALVPKILSGEYRFSHNQLLSLSRLPAEDVKKFNRKIELDPTPYLYYKYLRNDHQSDKDSSGSDSSKSVPSVKDMPEYDPDAEINSLALTIPSWKSSIERTKEHANLAAISTGARKKVLKVLFELRITISDMIVTLQEETWKT